MNLVYYVKGFPPFETGGPVNVAYHLLRELLRDPATRITLLVQTDGPEEEIHRAFSNAPNLTVVRLRYYPSVQDLSIIPQVARAVRDADLVHFNEFPFRHVIFILLAKLRRVPLVLSLHGLFSREIDTIFGGTYPLVLLSKGHHVAFRYPSSTRRILGALHRWFAKVWTALVANSDVLRVQAASTEGFEPQRIWVIPNAVDSPAQPPSAPDHHDGRQRLLFVGKLEEIKGPDLLFMALDRLGQRNLHVHLSVVGTGSMEALLEAKAGRLAGHEITFHGTKQRDELDRLYRWADAVVVPSRNESFPLVVLEAMAARRALVATSVGGIPEILRSPRNAILVDPDPESIAQGIMRLLDDPDLRSEMADANYADVQKYSWPAVAAKYEQLFRLLSQSEPMTVELG